jgi:3-dehydroquinate dehydratase-2
MKIKVLFGSNLDILQFRDPKVYGGYSLDLIRRELEDKYKAIDFTFFQSNSEGALIDDIHSSFDYDAIIVNCGAYTHTSISIRDALDALSIVKVEVHLSDIYKREDFRKVNYIKDVCCHSIVGKGINGYYEAVEFIVDKLKSNKPANA